MKRTLTTLFSTALALCSINAFAALKPFDESVREINDIISSTEVALKLNNLYAIESLVRDPENVNKYTLTTKRGQCSLSISLIIKPKPDGWAGPKQYDLQVSDLVCKDSP